MEGGGSFEPPIDGVTRLIRGFCVDRQRVGESLPRTARVVGIAFRRERLGDRPRIDLRSSAHIGWDDAKILPAFSMFLVAVIAAGPGYGFDRRRAQADRRHQGIAAVFLQRYQWPLDGHFDFALVWMFSSIVIISGLTGSIATALTVGQLTPSVNGPKDLRRLIVRLIWRSSNTSKVRRGKRFWNFIESRPSP